MGDKRARRYNCNICGTRIQTVEEIIGVRDPGRSAKEYVPIDEGRLQKIREKWREWKNE